jgi:hypothetical protein
MDNSHGIIMKMKTLAALLILGCMTASLSAQAAVSEAETSIICDAKVGYPGSFDKQVSHFYAGFGVGAQAAGDKEGKTPFPEEIKKLDSIAGELRKDCSKVAATMTNAKAFIEMMKGRCGSLCISIIGTSTSKRPACGHACDGAAKDQQELIAALGPTLKGLGECKSKLVTTQAILEGQTNSIAADKSKKLSDAIAPAAGGKGSSSSGSAAIKRETPVE